MFVALNIINSDRSADARTALSIIVSGLMGAAGAHPPASCLARGASMQRAWLSG
jgi:hypothetical protein